MLNLNTVMHNSSVKQEYLLTCVSAHRWTEKKALANSWNVNNLSRITLCWCSSHWSWWVCLNSRSARCALTLLGEALLVLAALQSGSIVFGSQVGTLNNFVKNSLPWFQKITRKARFQSTLQGRERPNLARYLFFLLLVFSWNKFAARRRVWWLCIGRGRWESDQRTLAPRAASRQAFQRPAFQSWPSELGSGRSFGRELAVEACN